MQVVVLLGICLQRGLRFIHVSFHCSRPLYPIQQCAEPHETIISAVPLATDHVMVQLVWVHEVDHIVAGRQCYVDRMDEKKGGDRF
jgi:hypothetical protein